MKNTYAMEPDKPRLAHRFVTYVKNFSALDGIKNETWMYLSEHRKSLNVDAAEDKIIPYADFENYLH